MWHWTTFTLISLCISSVGNAITPKEIADSGVEYVCKNNAWFSSDFADIVKMHSLGDFVIIFDPEKGLQKSLASLWGDKGFVLGWGFQSSEAFSHLTRKVTGITSVKTCLLKPNTQLDFDPIASACGPRAASLMMTYPWEITFRYGKYLTFASEYSATETLECVMVEK